MSDYNTYKTAGIFDEYVKIFPERQLLLSHVKALAAGFKGVYCVIAGGFLFKIMAKLPLDASDIDVFCNHKAIYKEIVKAYNADGATAQPNYAVVKNTHLVNTYQIIEFNINIQLIYKSFKSAKQLVDLFDLSICKAWMEDDTIYIHPKMERCIKEKIILDGRMHAPYINLPRLEKYIALGYAPKGKILLKIKEGVQIRRDLAVHDPNKDKKKEKRIDYHENVADPIARNVRDAHRAQEPGIFGGAIGVNGADNDVIYAIPPVEPLRAGRMVVFDEAPLVGEPITTSEYGYSLNNDKGIHLPKYEAMLREEYAKKEQLQWESKSVYITSTSTNTGYFQYVGYNNQANGIDQFINNPYVEDRLPPVRPAPLPNNAGGNNEHQRRAAQRNEEYNRLRNEYLRGRDRI